MSVETANLVFNYLDWCKEQGLPLEATKRIDTAKRYGTYLHRQGVEVSYFDLLMMTGEHRAAYFG